MADGTTVTSQRVDPCDGPHGVSRPTPSVGHLPEPNVLHSSRLEDVKSYAGRDITVIGAGQSALETAALLHEAGASVRMVVKGDHIEWNGPSKPRPLWYRIKAPDAGIAMGWTTFAIAELPRVFRWYFPPEKRHRVRRRRLWSERLVVVARSRGRPDRDAS